MGKLRGGCWGEGGRARGRAGCDKSQVLGDSSKTHVFLSWRGGSVEISDLGNYVPRMN